MGPRCWSCDAGGLGLGLFCSAVLPASFRRQLIPLLKPSALRVVLSRTLHVYAELALTARLSSETILVEANRVQPALERATPPRLRSLNGKTPLDRLLVLRSLISTSEKSPPGSAIASTAPANLARSSYPLLFRSLRPQPLGSMRQELQTVYHTIFRHSPSSRTARPHFADPARCFDRDESGVHRFQGVRLGGGGSLWIFKKHF